jgi:hypothetical protein
MADFDPRAAGVSIIQGLAFVRDTFRDINRLLETIDAIFNQERPRWEAIESQVTWENSTIIGRPDQWLPRHFWRMYRKDPKPKTWSRAAIIDVELQSQRGLTHEPWIGCYLLDSPKVKPIGEWSGSWVHAMNEPDSTELQWIDGMERQAFGWTEIQKKGDDPIKATGYFLRLTDLRSAEDVTRLIVQPIAALDREWALSALPKLPMWDSAAP